jgi:replication fork clamp-binding protein CrfC
VRRYFFINHEKIMPDSDGVQYVMKCLGERSEKEDKFYALNDSFDNFKAAYPFMLSNALKLKEAEEKGREEHDKAILYPYAKFPSEIIPGKLYLVPNK